MKHKLITCLCLLILALNFAYTKQNVAKELMSPPRSTDRPDLIVTNNYYDLSVSSGTSDLGTYTVCTGDSHPATIQMGSKQEVLYHGVAHDPWSTFLSVKSYSSNRIYISGGHSPTPDSGFTLVSLYPYGTVTQQGNTGILSSWVLNGQPDSLKIDQLTYIEGSQFEDSKIGVLTKIKNLSATSVSLGIRYEWDIMIDGNDGSTAREKNPEGSWLVYETEWASINFTHYEITDDSLAPTFYNLGSVIGPAYFEPIPSEPDLLQFASWSDSYNRAFGYIPTGQYIYNDDSAILYYWGSDSTNTIAIAPGDSVVVVQYLFASLISFEYQVDNLIKNSYETNYIGDSIYNITGEQQTKTQTVLPNISAVYHVKIENDGNGQDGFTVTGPAGSSGWNVAYYDQLVGGNNITSQVTGPGWQTGGLNPDESKEIRVEVMPDIMVPSGDSFTVLVLSTSQANNQKQDAVKAVTIVLPSHDVGVNEIIAPTGTIIEGTSVTPTSIVENYGNETETFWVKFKFNGLYDESLEVTLDAGEVDTVEFTPWTAALGSYNTLSYSMLEGDENLTNDTAYGEFVVVTGVIHDVGVTEIIAPTGTILEGATVTPTAVVENFGTETETFAVVFNFASTVLQTAVPQVSVLGAQNVAKVNTIQYIVDEVYTDTLSITLSAGEVDTVEFDPWTAVIGTYEEMSYSLLDGDENHANDTAYGRFVVVSSTGHDVGVLEILEPLDTIDAGSTVTPTAVVKNFGEHYENFWVFFNIGCAYSNFRYIGLAAGEVDTVVFDPWLAVAGFYNEEATTYLENDENPDNNAVNEWLAVTEPSEPIAGYKVPIDFKLFKPYPNPTTNNLTINYALPQSSPVELMIFDVNGREVKRLIAGTKAPGYYQINTDCRELGSGIYLVKMKADKFEALEKLIVTK